MVYGRKENNPPEEEGTRWDVSGRQDTYEGATALKEAIEINSDHLDVKVHKVKGQFVIKTREKPLDEQETSSRTKSTKKKKRAGRRRKSKEGAHADMD